MIEPRVGPGTDVSESGVQKSSAKNSGTGKSAASNPGATAAQQLLAKESDIDHASKSLKAMAHPLRLKILCILGNAKEASVQDLVYRVGTSQSNISQHLSILREKQILGSRKDANKVYYRISDERILRLIESLRFAFCPNN